MEAQASGTAESEERVEFKTWSPLNFLSGFKGLREKQRGLVEAAWMSYFSRGGYADSWVHTEGLQGEKQSSLWSQAAELGSL